VAQVSFLQTLMPDAEAQAKWVKPAPAGSRLSYQRTAFANWLTDTEQRGRQSRRAGDRQPVVGATLRPRAGRDGERLRGSRRARRRTRSCWTTSAGELIRGGWKLKPIHRLIVTSAAYRQSSARDEAKVKLDPENKLVWRQPVRRLQAEVIRDSILFVGGRLNTTMYGPGTLSEESPRRSIYFTMKRSKLIPSLVVFDAPDGTVGGGRPPEHDGRPAVAAPDEQPVRPGRGLRPREACF
jgi:hypothetical protein